MARFHTFKYLNKERSTCIDLDHICRIEPANETDYGVKVWLTGQETVFEFGGPWEVWMKMLNGDEGVIPNRPMNDE